MKATTQDTHLLNERGRLVSADPYSNPEGFLQQVYGLLDLRELELAEPLREFARDRTQGAIVVGGLPIDVDDSVATPTHIATGSPKATFLSEFVLVAIGSILGRPFGFADEHSGQLIENIFPVPTHQAMQVSSSAAELTLHVDAGHHPLVPSYTLLLGLRGESDQCVLTYFASMPDAVAALDPEMQVQLKQSRFVIKPEISFRAGQPRICPLWTGDGDEQEFLFDFDLVEGIDSSAKDVVSALKASLTTAVRSVEIGAGHLLVLKNLQVVHGRCHYLAHYDGTDRWLQRTYVNTENRMRGEPCIVTSSSLSSSTDPASPQKPNGLGHATDSVGATL